MSFSPNLRHRARLFRDMTRDHNNTNRSNPSDHGSIPESTISDFDPENEALMSTRQMDNTNTNHRLPELRASARKFARRNEPEPDFVMDTSAIGKAFPDFSMGGSSSEEADDSIEIGRGGKNPARRSADAREFSSNAPFDNGNDSFRTSKAMIGSFEVLATPPARPRRSLGTQAESGSLRKNHQIRAMAVSQKENVAPNKDPSPPPAKTSDYLSNGTKATAPRRTLAEIHARVTSEDDGSLLSDERPPSINIAARNTRFVNPRSRQTSDSGAGVSVPTKFTNTENFLQNLATGSHNRNSEKQHQPTATIGTTQQSFLLPDLPNLSELVSGVFNDGTPIFSRSGKPRSRFVAPPHPEKADHIPIESIPVPAQERAIFVSLKLLQDKVADMETDKAEAEKRVEDLKNEINMLKAQRKEQEKRRRSDSALGMTDGGSDGDGRRTGNWIIEKTKLESTVKSLHARLDTATRKVSVSEITIKNLTTERDNAVSQLGVAYYNSEGLKTENEILRKENETLKIRLAQMESQHKNETQTWKKMEKTFQKQLERRDDGLRELNETTRKIWELRSDLPAPYNGKEASKRTGTSEEDFCQHIHTDDALEGQTQSKTEARKASSTGRKESAAGSSIARPEAVNARYRSASSRRVSTRAVGDKAEQVQKKKRTRRIVVEETIDTDESEGDVLLDPANVSAASRMVEEETHNSQHRAMAGKGRGDESSENMTTLSFQDHMEKLRQTLEDEQRSRKERDAANAAAARDEENETVRTEKSTRHPRAALPRKSSMKDLTERTAGNKPQNDEEVTGRDSAKSGGENLAKDESMHSKTGAFNRRHSDGTVIGKMNNRRRLSAHGMTSAFILPDITIKGSSATDGLSESAKRVLHGLVNHDPKTCMVCCRISTNDTTKRIGGGKVKATFTIPKPIPVSERMPQPGEWNEEPTIRPAQHPAIALATVLKSLKDENDHLKMKLQRYQAMYCSHDASLGKRRREWLNKRITSLMKLIETKSAQEYALYDVVEGQKADGREMTQEEVEIELTNVGIDISKLHLRGGELKHTKRNRVTYAENDTTGGRDVEGNSADEGEFDDDDDDLPWEGIPDDEETDGTDS